MEPLYCGHLGGPGGVSYIHVYIQVVVLASLAQLLVCVELARCARSVQMQIKHVICM